MRALLLEADRHIQGMAGGSRYLLYSYLRATAAAVARADSFYVGFCRDDRTIVFPYNYDGREYDDPNVNPWRPGGLTEWIVANRRSYWSRHDGGALLHRGRAFGDSGRRSAEAIASPILARADGRGRPTRVVGILSLLSYENGVYAEETVRFLECLAGSVATLLEREQEDRERRRGFGQPGDAAAAVVAAAAATSPLLPMLSDAADSIGGRLSALRRQAEAVRAALALAAGEGDDLYAAADALCRECERAQTDTIDLLLRTMVRPQPNPLALLTAKEQEVAALIARGLSNRAIAERLFVSETTVKTHCSSIIRKLDAGGRSGVAQMVRPFLDADRRDVATFSPPSEEA